MAAIDVVNRVLREFRRYTGDGLPGEPVNAPLPVGDPQSGVHNPKKSELRAALLAPLEDAGQSVVEAEAAAARAEAARDDIEEKWLGAHPDDASATAAAGGSPIVGAEYWNTTLGKRKTWDGAVWQENDVALNDGAVTEPKLDAAVLADMRMVDPNGPRPHLIYGNASTVRLAVSSFPLGGFRYRGRYTLGRARVVDLPASHFTVQPASFGVTMPIKYSSWYAGFFLAKENESVGAPRLMPYLRVYSRSGNTITLNAAGERIETPTPATSYGWADNALAGAKVLIISEAGRWTAGRTTTVVSNTGTTITLEDAGALGDTIYGGPSMDWILVAPPGYDFHEFGWATDFYFDTAEVRNIYDTGFSVKSRMPHPLVANYRTGSVPFESAATVNFGGFISPLATGIRLAARSFFSTSQLGEFSEHISADTGNHYVYHGTTYKAAPGNQTIIHEAIDAAFLYHQWLAYWNASSPAGFVGTRMDGRLNVNGYDIP